MVSARGLAIVCAGVCTGAGILAGAAGEAAARPRDGLMVKGPYLQDLAPTSITIMWQLDEKRPARVLVEGPGGPRAQDVAAARTGEVTITGLSPASRYRYRVLIDDRSWDGELATAPPNGKDVPYTFTVFGDTRYGIEPHRRLVERMLREAPAFVLGTGDMVDDGARQDQWQQFFDAEAPLLRNHVFFPSVGNHDRQGRGRTTDSYRSLFSLPENGGETERYYAFTYGPARVLVLDSNIYSFALTDQTAWIERELIAARQDPGVRQIFVVMHHPPFSISLHGGQKDLRERWAPLFEKFGVTAVFSGHDHVYTRAEHNGVRYFVSGGGGAPLYPRRPRPSAIDAAAVQKFDRVYHYLRVAVTGRRVEVTGIRLDGTTIETTAWNLPPASAPARAPAAVPASAPPPGPSPLRPTVEAGAPGSLAAVAAVAAAAPPAPRGQGDRSPRAGGDGGDAGRSYLWFGLGAVGLLLASAVAVVRTLRR